MPSIQERVVATGRGVRAERDLAEAAAYFYVLALLKARGDAGAAKMLAKFEACLAREFACHLDMAIAGETAIRDLRGGEMAKPLAGWRRRGAIGERTGSPTSQHRPRCGAEREVVRVQRGTGEPTPDSAGVPVDEGAAARAASLGAHGSSPGRIRWGREGPQGPLRDPPLG
jgi:hypothetical protein